jgi:hypothetical protein
MWFPVGLSARLCGQIIAQPFRSNPAPAIFHFSPGLGHLLPESLQESAASETEWHTPEACVQAAKQAGSPAVWLGGMEPLLHPAIGRVTAALEKSGRYVFLDTSGSDLPKKVHEFRPAERFFFAFRASCDDVAQDGGAHDGAFHNVNQALRIVKLSGFFACVHVIVSAQTSSPAVLSLLRLLEASRADGITVSSGGAYAGPSRDAVLGQKLSEITEMVPSWRWRDFSRTLEASYLQTSAAKEESNMQARGADACEESA